MGTFLLSVIIPTRNESRNLTACVESFSDAVAAGWCEVLVVDNNSDDGTPQLAATLGARVFSQGPERSTQRNRGWREAVAPFVLFMDADMSLPPETLAEIHTCLTSPQPPDALYIRERRTGGGWWTRVRNFERGFYNATCIDGLRVFRRALLETTGGYDETLFACEDWDLDRRILALTENIALTNGFLLHHEERLTFRRHLRKKRYYSVSFSAYIKKWGWDPVTRRQFGFWYRFVTVFLENGKWRQALRHPFLLLAVWAERVCVGLLCLRAVKKG